MKYILIDYANGTVEQSDEDPTAIPACKQNISDGDLDVVRVSDSVMQRANAGRAGVAWNDLDNADLDIFKDKPEPDEEDDWHD